jgi:RHS repeat-associated protein
MNTILHYDGQPLDPVTGCYGLGDGYRSYHPGLMRFMAPDDLSPFGMGGANPYAYCAGDPINRADPSGHVSLPNLAAVDTHFSALLGLLPEDELQALYTRVSDKIGAAASDTSKAMADFETDQIKAWKSSKGRLMRKSIRIDTMDPQIPRLNVFAYSDSLGKFGKRLNVMAHGEFNVMGWVHVADGIKRPASQFAETFVGETKSFDVVRVLMCHSADGGVDSTAAAFARVTGNPSIGFQGVLKVFWQDRDLAMYGDYPPPFGGPQMMGHYYDHLLHQARFQSQDPEALAREWFMVRSRGVTIAGTPELYKPVMFRP